MGPGVLGETHPAVPVVSNTVCTAPNPTCHQGGPNARGRVGGDGHRRPASSSELGRKPPVPPRAALSLWSWCGGLLRGPRPDKGRRRGAGCLLPCWLEIRHSGRVGWAVLLCAAEPCRALGAPVQLGEERLPVWGCGHSGHVRLAGHMPWDTSAASAGHRDVKKGVPGSWPTGPGTARSPQVAGPCPWAPHCPRTTSPALLPASASRLTKTPVTGRLGGGSRKNHVVGVTTVTWRRTDTQLWVSGGGEQPLPGWGSC